ncbi:MAG: ABC transporter ATP-binding protein, partial [Actinobacteria bacterium]|nr:ABC transporter ATP-binding protein [Actinomycetota bacterium]
MVMMGAGGGAFMGPTATQSSATAGLPFAGVPTEMQEGADKILAKEPEHPAPNIIFSPDSTKQQKYGLWLLIRPRWVAAFVGLVLLILETGTALLGPVLTQQGIDNGVIARDKDFLNTVVYLFLAVIGLNILLSFLRQRWNGRLGEDLLHDLRIKLFSHFQRLGIDWYTSEKSGVLLSRMTSDVEALTLLINEGFVNLVIQGVTVGVVTVILFVYDPTLALLLLGLALPPLITLTIWFRSVSQRGYAAVRDRIAELLADLSENLSGIRVISALN